ncbi:MAG TPA: FMN-binding protein [Bacteroidales bacterium]|nr:FMN-binding protein [Bacteroidales bacterium]HRX95565.1 FMN-binding protein [Bacteroidales bacterium]
MLSKILSVIFVVFSLPICCYSQSQPDFNHRLIIKTLAKQNSNITYRELKYNNADSELVNEENFGKFFKVEGDSTSQYAYLYVGRVVSCHAGGCSVDNGTSKNENPEYFDYFIIFNAQKIVQQVRVFNYQATHGQEISAKGWLKQFVGYDGNKSLLASKDIDAISGATISVNAITLDISEKTALLNQLKIINP